MSKRPTNRRGMLRLSQPLAGFTLIELMIAMLLGLIVIAGVTSVFLATQRSYRTNDALGDVQDGSRIAFEMLARDIRDAGLTGCDNSSDRVANVLSGSTTNWYADWNNALHGYDNATAIDDPALATLPTTGATSPVIGNGSVHLISTGSLDVTIGQTPSKDAASFFLNTSTAELSSGDLIMVCDFDHAAIMQISTYNGKVTVTHNTGSGTPGNCTKNLSYPTPSPCNNSGSAGYTYGPNSRVAKLTAVDWYIGNNPVDGKSLYRLSAVNSGGNIASTPQEMVRNVTGMTIKYLQAPSTVAGGPLTNFDTAASVTNWAVADAVQVTLTVESTDQRAGVDAAPLTRTFTTTTAVRNRVP